MARQVKWTEEAWNDLEETADFIAKDSPYYAATFVRKVRELARSLRQLTERGRVVPEFNRVDIRELFIGNYRLIYKITDRVVFIIGFIHGARDLWALWEREDRTLN